MIHIGTTDRARDPISGVGTRLGVMAIGLACAVAATLALGVGVASAASRGFKIYNEGAHALRLTSVTPVPGNVICGKGGCFNADYPMEFEGRPADGAVLAPSAAQDWELKWHGYAAKLTYAIVGTHATFEATIRTWFSSNDSTCTIVPASVGTCTAEGLKLTVKTHPGVGSASSRGFKLYNLSNYHLRLAHVDPMDDYPVDFEGRPPDGAGLEPGALNDWELKYHGYAAKLIYDIVGYPEGARHLRVTIRTGVFANDSTCKWYPIGLGTCTAGGLALTVNNTPGTVITIPAEQREDAAATLHDLCVNSDLATCDFKPTKEDKTHTPAHVVGEGVANCGDTPVETVYKATDEVDQTNSIGVSLSVGANLFKIINVAISTTYRHDWTQKHTFEQDVSLHINPGFIAWVTATAPIFRDTGDFTLKLGNTTWNLGGVYFDTPDPDRSGQYVADDAKLTPKKYKEACNHQPPSLVKVPVSYIPISTAVGQAPR